MVLYFGSDVACEENHRWPHGQSAAIRIEPSGSKPWQETMSCAFGQDTLFSQCLSHDPG